MHLVEVPPGDTALFYAKCLHCDRGFGKGDQPELAYEGWVTIGVGRAAASHQVAMHKACVEDMRGQPTPAEVTDRRKAARRRLLADRRALAVKSDDGARKAG